MNVRKRDYIWNTVGVLLQNAVSPVLLLVVTRLNGIQASGLFSFAFSVSLLLYALGMWGGRTYQVSDVKKEFQPRSYIMVRIVLAIFALTVAIIFCAVNQYDVYKTSVILMLVVFKLLESFADVLYGILQTNDRLYMSGKSLTVKASLGILVFTIVDLITDSILAGTCGIIIVNILVFFCYDLAQTNKFEKIYFPKHEIKRYIGEAKEILKRCASVFAVMFLAMFSLNVPRYFIDLHSTKEVGYFGIIAMPITLIVLVITFILQPNVVKLAKLCSTDEIAQFRKEVNKVLFFSIVIGLVVLLVTVLIGTWLLRLIFGVDFDGHAVALDMIVTGGIASAIVTVYLNVFVIMRKVKFPLIVLIVTNLLLIPMSYYSVQYCSLLGGVAAFTVTSFAQLALIVVYFNVMQKRKMINEKN